MRLIIKLITLFMAAVFVGFAFSPLETQTFRDALLDILDEQGKSTSNQEKYDVRTKSFEQLSGDESPQFP